MGKLVVLLMAAASLTLGAAMQMTVEQLKEFIRSSVKMKYDDRKVAEYLRKVKLTSRLEDRTIEDLQSIGAGPKTLSALYDLRDVTASLPLAAPAPPKPVYVPPPPPDSIEQKRVLAEVTEYALNYTARMPDFICTQVTRRYVDPSGMEFWQRQDVITERLTFFEKREDYTVVLINNRTAGNVKHEQLGGATSSGEFGSMMKDIFDPWTQTQFEWERWATLRGKRMHVYTYRVEQGRSKYTILSQGSERITVGYHGLIYVDRDSNTVAKITLEADDIPTGYPIREVHLSLDYDKATIADREYVLPLKAELTSRQGSKFLIKNDVEFRMYRKFTAESTITAYEPEAIPDSAIKEQPPAPPAEKKP
jgi:hypothetical protein